MHLQPWPAVSDQQIFQHKNHHTRPSVKHGLMASVQRDIHQTCESALHVNSAGEIAHQ